MTTTRPTPTDDAPRPIPMWASIPTILACLAAGVWIVHWYVGTHPRADEPHLLGDVAGRPVVSRPPPEPGGRGQGGPARFFNSLFSGGGPRNVRQTNPQMFQAYTEHAQANFNVPDGRPPTLGVLTYGQEPAYSFVPADVRQTVWDARKLVNDPRYVTALKLTPPQANRIRQRTRLAATAAPSDRALLTADFAAFRAAAPKDQPAAKAKLLADVDAVADRSQAATRQTFIESAKQIDNVVSPQQWAQFKAMGG